LKDKLIQIKEKSDKLYENGKPILPDKYYDKVVDEIEKINHEDETLKKVGWSSSKVKLPIPLGSLTKIKTNKDLQLWLKKVNNQNYVITSKLDGISILLCYKNGNLINAFTRGDGHNGRNILTYIKHVKNVPTKVNKESSEFLGNEFFIRGECIMKDDTFDKYSKQGFKVARNLVASAFNKSDMNKSLLEDINFIPYQIIKPEMSKIDQLNELIALGFKIVDYKIINNLNIENLSEMILQFRKRSDFYLDGIVIDIDNLQKRNELGFEGSTLNPSYSKAFKIRSSDEEYLSEVLDIQWNVSRMGLLKPRVQIKPVDIKGTVISWLSGKNALFISDQKINKGSILLITKSGDVIPDILDNLDTPKCNSKLPDKCPSCGESVKWNDNKVELICSNLNCYQRKLKELSFFFTNINVFGLNEDRIKKLSDNGFDTIFKILNMNPDDIKNISGFGDISANNICNAIKDACTNISHAKIMASTGFFENLGERKIQKILDEIPFDDLKKDNKYDIHSIKGFSYISEKQFNQGLNKFLEWFEVNKHSFTIKKEQKGNETVNTINIVFSGFRDKTFAQMLEEKGYKIQSGVSKKTNYVICKDLSSKSSKVKKAKEMNIPVILLKDFQMKF